MEFENLHKRVDHQDDPDRCQRGTPHGPCPYKRIEGSEFCGIHGGAKAIEQAKEKSKRTYLAAQWHHQVAQFADDPDLKSLRQEVGIMRLLLQQTMARCLTTNDLLLRSSTISEMLARIEKLVLSCHTLDTKLGLMLDKVQLTEFGLRVVELVSEFISSPDVLAKFADRLVETIKTTGTAEGRAQSFLASN